MPKPRTDSRSRLISSARRLLQRQGYQGTGLSQIVGESGAPRGSVYFLFPGGKEELAIAAIHESRQEVTGHLLAMAETCPSAAEWIDAITQHFAYDLEQSDFTEGCPVSTVSLDSVPASPDLHAVCKEAYNEWLSTIATILVRFGIEAPQATQTATLILSAAEGALILSRVQQSTSALWSVAEQLKRVVVRPD